MDIPACDIEANRPLALESTCGLGAAIWTIDSGSIDRVPVFIRATRLRTADRAWTNHASQFDLALDNLPIDTRWLLRLHAQQRPMIRLARELADKQPMLPDSLTGWTDPWPCGPTASSSS